MGIVSIFWLPISIGPSHLRIYNFLVADQTKTIASFNETHWHVHSPRSWKRHGPVIIRKFLVGRLFVLWRSAEIRNWKFTLIIGEVREFVANARGNVDVSVRSEEKVNFSWLNIYRTSLSRDILSCPCVKITWCGRLKAQLRGSCQDWFRQNEKNRSIKALNREIFEYSNFSTACIERFHLIGKFDCLKRLLPS